MTKKKSTKSPTYFESVFRYDKKQHETEQRYRAVVKWIFDYLRNMMIVGVILFLGQSAENQVLTQIGYLGLGLLWMYLMIYVEPFSFKPFHPIRNKKIANFLNYIILLCNHSACYSRAANWIDIRR